MGYSHASWELGREECGHWNRQREDGENVAMDMVPTDSMKASPQDPEHTNALAERGEDALFLGARPSSSFYGLLGFLPLFPLTFSLLQSLFNLPNILCRSSFAPAVFWQETPQNRGSA